jgi:hypothetical protein
MSIVINGTSASKDAAAAASDNPMISPEQVVEQLRALRRQIPEFVQLSRQDVLRMRREASLNADFTQAGISVVGASEVVQLAIGNSSEDVHQAEAELARWSVVESEFRAMLRGVNVANLVRRHRIARVAMQAYNLSRQLAREEAHAQLRPHVEAMMRIRKFGRRRVKAAAEPEVPQQVS